MPSPARLSPAASSLLDRLAAGVAVADPAAVVVAHPDDEILGLGGRMDLLSDLRLIHLTDGAPRDGADARRAGFDTPDAYADARARELAQALETVGVRPERRAYGLPDQGAAERLSELVPRLADDLTGRAAVFTHAYEGGHPDHDAAAFAVQAACTLLAQSGRPAPARYEFAGYHQRDGALTVGVFHADPACPETEVRLAAPERRRKRSALACFASQGAVIDWFSPALERWRPAPAYDFAAPPPPGGCLYDGFGWALTGDVWRERVGAARSALRLDS